MRIRHMWMTVLHRLVPVPMAVRCSGHRGVRVQMVAVVMRVRMLVFERFVGVLMRVALGQMQEHAGQHQQRTGAEPHGRSTLAQRIGDGGADEGRKREHRASARCAEFALRQKI